MARQIPNKYAGKCRTCEKPVAAQAGFLTGKPGSWGVLCYSCATGAEATPEVIKPTKSFPLTSEQEKAVALFSEGHSIAIQAGAGTGKTSTLVAIAKSTNRNGQYVAFNSAVVKDAGFKFSGTNCSAATAHSLAFRQVGKLYKSRLNAQRQSSFDIARQLGIEPFYYHVDGVQKVIQPSALAGSVIDAIKTFCNSRAEKVDSSFIRYIDGIDTPNADGSRTYENNNAVQNHLAGAIKFAWLDIIDVSGTLRFTHDNYLKIWELGIHGDPIIPGDYILFDEAQDASPVLLSVVEQQAKQVVFVGDAQQAIYEWRGAIDALDTVSADSTCYLTNSFRFGPEIAKVANTLLETIPSAVLRLEGLGATGSVSSCDSPDAILTRTNAGAITVVLEALQQSKTVHLVGGGSDIARFAKAALRLQQGQRVDHEELSIFSSWSEVQDYVKNDPQGSELGLLVRLIDQYGVSEILRAVDNTVSEEDADLVVSTAHKSKGREWDKVRIHGDFPQELTNDADRRLAYVAVTRARLVLDITSCAPVLSIINGGI